MWIDEYFGSPFGNGSEVFGTRIDRADDNHKKHKQEHKMRKVIGKQDSTRIRFVLFVLKQISSPT
jgi:hypothetical protein